MSCINPLLIKGGHYRFVIRSDSLKGYDTMPTDLFTVPCGSCLPCRIKRIQDWTLRLMFELNYWDRAVFTTLTYSDDYIEKLRQPSGGYSLDKEDLTLFLKRLRYYHSDKIKYLACGEYGDLSGRPHYHLIIYGIGLSDRYSPDNRSYLSDDMVIERSWPYGMVNNGFVTINSCRYVVGYVAKKTLGNKSKEFYGDLLPPFIRMSKGIGLKFFEDHLDYFRKGFISFNGKDINLPRYFYDRIRNDDIFKDNIFELTRKGFCIQRNKTFKEVCNNLLDKGIDIKEVYDERVINHLIRRQTVKNKCILEKQLKAKSALYKARFNLFKRGQL